jgi:solute carrier family 35 protein E1
VLLRLLIICTAVTTPHMPTPPNCARLPAPAPQASYMVLDQGISPVTFSVGNTMKRVAVVVSSILFFRNPVSTLNWVGSMIALLGTGLYSLAKQRASDEAKAAKQAKAA